MSRDELLKTRWEVVKDKISAQFGDGEILELDAIIYLIVGGKVIILCRYTPILLLFPFPLFFNTFSLTIYQFPLEIMGFFLL